MKPELLRHVIQARQRRPAPASSCCTPSVDRREERRLQTPTTWKLDELTRRLAILCERYEVPVSTAEGVSGL